MKFISKCKCGNNKFLIFTEKMYEGWIDNGKILVCEPEAEHIKEIKCSKCSRKYKLENFREIDY